MPNRRDAVRSGKGTWVPSKARRSALIAAAMAAVLMALLYSPFENSRRESARRAVRGEMSRYAQSLRAAVERRIGLLSGFRSFIESRPTLESLEREFALFARGSLTGASGVSAIQYLRGGRIIEIWPTEGNESALGFDFLADPRPHVRDDYLRSASAPRVTVTGPVALVEGGRGILLRERVIPRPGFPEIAAIVLDVPSLVSESGIPDGNSGLNLEIRNRNMFWVGGDPEGSAVEPESLAVSIEDGNWYILGAPQEGWSARTARGRWEFLAASSLIVFGAGILGFFVGGREDRLAKEVEVHGKRMDLVLKAGRMGTWELDIKSGNMIGNRVAAAMLGFDLDKLEGYLGDFLERVHPEDLDLVRRTIDEICVGERPYYMLEYRLQQSDGSYRWVLGICQLERNALGEPAKMLGVVSDATERREMEERLRHSQRLEAVGTLAGGVAHDFNNLLTAMVGFTELALDRARVLEDSDGTESVQNDLQQVLATADRAAALTAQLLAFSRRTANTPARAELDKVVTEIVPMLQRIIGDDHALVTDLAPDLPSVWIDSGQMTQVLLNLVVNARDAMTSPGSVVIRTSLVSADRGDEYDDAPPGEWVCLEVRDTGVGMSPDTQSRIFEPYFTTKSVGRGTGLGLAVVYGAVQNAGGDITVRSVVGEGSVFRVYLPPSRAAENSLLPSE